MKKERYITDEEREKCRKVANAFEELYELTDIIVVDAGRYGFVKLQYYNPNAGFDDVITYTDSKTMFEDLWQDYFYDRLLTPVLGTPIAELEYDDIYKCLSKETQDEIMAKRAYFKEKSEENS
ncbi:MAG: hypothetical protein NC429_08180 [Lachnospiraceae bacterium]|nr:hypothetical protein [Lachnospiraceae bacterium]